MKPAALLTLALILATGFTGTAAVAAGDAEAKVCSACGPLCTLK